MRHSIIGWVTFIIGQLTSETVGVEPAISCTVSSLTARYHSIALFVIKKY